MLIRSRNLIWIVLGLGLLAAVGTVAHGGLFETRQSGASIPTTRVERGNVELSVYTTGTLASSHTATLLAPPVSGGSLQITHLLKTGTRVKAGDMVMEFDPTEQEYNLEQARTDLAQAEQEIAKARADAEVQTADDKVALLKAQFDVKRAEFEVSKNELVSAIDAKKNDLALAEAKRALAQLESDIKSHAAANQANLALNEEKQRKATLTIEEAQRNIDNMKVKSPLDGLVEVERNERAYGGIIISGMVFPTYREGDQVYPGASIAQVVDPSAMEISGKVQEADRANISIGQPVAVTVAPLPGKKLRGTVKSISGLASRGSFWQPGSSSQFDLLVQLTSQDPLLRPGFTADLVISGNSLNNVLYLPPQAIFQKDGKSVVYAKSGSGFEAREVKIKDRTESRVAIDGLKEGTVVALVNPENPPSRSPKPTSGGPALTGAAR